MQASYWYYLLFVLGFCGIVALVAYNESEAEKVEWPAPAPALWQVTAPNGEQGWLFGTAHSLPDGLEWRTPELEDALANSRLLVVEIEDVGQSGGQDLFASLAHTPDQGLLIERVAPRHRAMVAQLLERAGADNDDFADTETWAAALTLASALREGDPANGVDRALIAQAENILALETRAEQLSIFDGLAPEDQADLLVLSARELTPSEPHIALKAWLTGDLDLLQDLGEDGILSDKQLRKALLIDRNLSWITPLTQVVENGENPLIALGAAHMIGPSGLPNLLAEQGYKVERVQ